MHVFTDPTNRRAYLDSFLLLFQLIAAAGLASMVLGTCLAAMRVSPVPVLRWIGTGWVTIFRNTPLTLVIFFAYFGLFVNLGVTIDSRNLNDNNFWLGVIGLSAYTASFVCEAIRSGINTIPVGQAEAARSLGLGFGQTLRLVILPQALRSVIAPLGSVFIALCKNATIVATIGVVESSSAMKDLINNNGDAVIPIFLVFAGTFVAFLVPAGYGFGWLANRMEVKR